MAHRFANLELFFIAAFILLGGAIILMAARLGFGSTEEPGSGFFPFFVGILILITAVSLGIRSVRAKSSKPLSSDFFNKNVKRFWGTAGTFLAWIVLAPWLGYIIVTFIASFAFSKILGEKGWGGSLSLALGVTALIYLLFDLWFYLDLPRGLLD